jgi:hypothetical protein
MIDKFVYNPKTGTGSLAASFSKGALRFVGGKLSKHEPGVKVNTPTGALTVRGGVFQGIVHGPNRALFAFVYGRHFSLARGGRMSLLRTARTVFAISGAGPAQMRDMVQADADLILAALSGKKTKLATGKQAKRSPGPIITESRRPAPIPTSLSSRTITTAPPRDSGERCQARADARSCASANPSVACRRPGRATRLRTARGATRRPSVPFSPAGA